MKKLIYAVFIILVAVTLIFPAASAVKAQQDISVLDNSTVTHFPMELIFNIDAQSSSDIVDIRLNYTVDRMNFAKVISESWTTFTPATRVQTSWTWDMRRRSLPPGVTVEYWWIIKNKNNDTLTTEVKNIEFWDDTHTWQKLTAGKLNLFWYDGSEDFARQLMASSQSSLDNFSTDTGATLEEPVKMLVYSSPDDLLKSMIAPREWTGGYAEYEYGIIAVAISPNDVASAKGVLGHELGHMVVGQISYSPYDVYPPFWLNEGLAMYAEYTDYSALNPQLKKIADSNRLISLRSLSSPFSAKTDLATLSYAESYSLIKFLITEYGQGKIVELLKTLKDGSTIDEALTKVYGFDEDGIQKLWVQSLTEATSQTSGLFDRDTAGILAYCQW